MRSQKSELNILLGDTFANHNAMSLPWLELFNSGLGVAHNMGEVEKLLV